MLSNRVASHPEAVSRSSCSVARKNGFAALLGCWRHGSAFLGQQDEQDDSDHVEQDHIIVVPMDVVPVRLHGFDQHHCAVGDVPPTDKSNHRSMLRRPPHRKKQKHTNRDENTEKHRLDLVLPFDHPLGMPQISVQKANEGKIEQSHKKQRSLCQPFSFQ